jgi:hypothetical protein
MSRFDDAAPFPYQLVRLLNRRDSHVSFEYARAYGRDSYVIARLSEMLTGCQRTPAKYRNGQIAEATEFAKRHRETGDEIDRQWSAHVDTCSARYDAKRAAEKLLEFA